MTKLVLERDLAAPAAKVFDFITRREHLLKWWGPEGMTLPDESLDFTRPGHWHSVMMSAEGQRFKVSGEVREVDPPHRVVLTWAWHDENGERGHESTVTIEVKSAGDAQSRLVLRHEGLADEESAKNHEMGWTSSLRKLERAFA